MSRWFGVGASALLAHSGCQLPSRQVDPENLGTLYPETSASGRPLDAFTDAGAERVASHAAGARCVQPPEDTSRMSKHSPGRPSCHDASVLESLDARGTPRYACVWKPSRRGPAGRLPLLVLFHRDAESPTDFESSWGVRSWVDGLRWGKRREERGVVVLAPQGRRMLGPDGLAFQKGGVDNPDIDMTATWVNDLVRQGIVDSSRIYALGEGTGAWMAELFAKSRPDDVAAFAMLEAQPRLAWSCAFGDAPPSIVLADVCADRSLEGEGGSGEIVWIDDHGLPTSQLDRVCPRNRRTGPWAKAMSNVGMPFFSRHTLRTGRRFDIPR